MDGSAAALVGINGHALMPTVSASCYVGYLTLREHVPCYSRRVSEASDGYLSLV
jgi:hypothetical protein